MKRSVELTAEEIALIVTALYFQQAEDWELEAKDHKAICDLVDRLVELE